MKNTLYIVWSDKNDLGINIVDEQHRAIVSIINSLHYFIQTGDEEEMIDPILTMLDQYIRIHFRTEEAFMAKSNYPAYEEHVVLHNKLIEKTKDLSGDTDLKKDPDVLLKFLAEWWLEHINKEDKTYTSYLKKLIDSGKLDIFSPPQKLVS